MNMLREVSLRYTHSTPNPEKDNSPLGGSIQYSYTYGRIVNDDKLDKIMQKNLKTCSGYDIFIAPDDPEEQFVINENDTKDVDDDI